MKKIEFLTVENFQSHSRTSVRFGDFTAIVGPTNSGKSALFRALQWALYNVPAGTNFIRTGTNVARVTVKFQDGSQIVRLRTRGKGTEDKNVYQLVSSDGNSVLLEHFGMGPVQEVLDFHGMYLVDLFNEKESLNICSQLDVPFFFSNTPQSRGVLVGKLSGVEEYDLANKLADQEARAQKKQKREYTKQLKEITADLKQYSKLDAEIEECERVEALLAEVKALYSQYITLSSCAESIRANKEQLAQTEKILSIQKSLEMALERFERVEHEFTLWKQVRPLTESLRACEDNLQKISEVFSPEYEQEVLLTGQSLDELCKQKERYVTLVKANASLTSNYEQFWELRRKTANVSEEAIMDAVSRLDTLRNDKMGKYCEVSQMGFKLQVNKEALEKSEQDESFAVKEFEASKQKYLSALEDAEICPICHSSLTERKLASISKKI